MEAGPGLACLPEESGHLYMLPSPGGKQSPHCREEKTEAQAQMGVRGGPCLSGWLRGLCVSPQPHSQVGMECLPPSLGVGRGPLTGSVLVGRRLSCCSPGKQATPPARKAGHGVPRRCRTGECPGLGWGG